MNALQFSATGDLAALSFVEVTKPLPAAGEVLVQVKAAGLNPSDVKNVLGRFPYTTLPRIPGRDFAGVVVEGPQELVGQEVWGTGRDLGFFADGSHAQYLTVSAKGVAHKPTHLSFAQAASLGVPYTTAWDALERSGVGKGTRLLVIGANGAVGSAALALAKIRGAQVLAAVRKADQVDALQAQGFDAIALGQPDALGSQVNAVFKGGADVIFDTTGFWLPAAVAGLAPFGRIAIIAAPIDGLCSCRPWRCTARAVRWWASIHCSTTASSARSCWSSSGGFLMRVRCRCRQACVKWRWRMGCSATRK